MLQLEELFQSFYFIQPHHTYHLQLKSTSDAKYNEVFNVNDTLAAESCFLLGLAPGTSHYQMITKGSCNGTFFISNIYYIRLMNISMSIICALFARCHLRSLKVNMWTPFLGGLFEENLPEQQKILDRFIDQLLLVVISLVNKLVSEQHMRQKVLESQWVHLKNTF